MTPPAFRAQTCKKGQTKRLSFFICAQNAPKCAILRFCPLCDSLHERKKRQISRDLSVLATCILRLQEKKRIIIHPAVITAECVYFSETLTVQSEPCLAFLLYLHIAMRRPKNGQHK